MAKKRKRIVVTIEKKIESIRRIEEGVEMKKVATELNVAPSTVSDWIKNKEKLVQYSLKTRGSISKTSSPKVVKKCVYEQINDGVFLWFVQQREMGIPTSGPLIRIKAAALAKFLGLEKFSASEGWLSRWKNRNGIKYGIAGEEWSNNWEHKQLVINEKKLSTDMRYNFDEINKNYTRDQIFTVAETGLNYKSLPAKINELEENAVGHKKSTKRITVMLCCNASGECRLPLAVVGKSEQPQSLENINGNALPVFYRCHKNAWISRELFVEWFQLQFVPKVVKYLNFKKQSHKAILLLDHALSHPDIETLKHGEIVVQFFPAIIANTVQPMSRGIIECFKRNYRKLMLSYILDVTSGNYLNWLNTIDIKEALYWCTESWDSIGESALQNGWNNLYNETGESAENGTDKELTALVKVIRGCEDITDEEVAEWAVSDSKRELSETELSEFITTDDEEDQYGDEDFSDINEHISLEDGFNALDVALKFVEQQDGSTPEDLMLIKKWRDIAARARIEK